ncbi:NADH-quinone oxidoreductase subunit B/C/D [Desulfovibrio sp. X2]|uniref:NADH-quinone oxidoreductase subunit B/C/D n=1 Tax=Desulfovibrio sp. X2 TaxID=941449 RepID=UPI00068B08C9
MKHPGDLVLSGVDTIVNWCRKNSVWPFFFGLSCCFVEEATAFTARYDIARFGSEVFRGSPRQADVLIVSGTVFKKVAPGVLRLYEQMCEPRWVISMGSCSNTGGMYDVYSVVQGVDQILPVDVYVPGCPPRPEALLQGLVQLQELIARNERPARPIFHLSGGSQGGRRTPLLDGATKTRDPRGPGLSGTPIRGTSMTPPFFTDSRSEGMWAPPAGRVELTEGESALAAELARRFGDAVRPLEPTSDMPTFETSPEKAAEVLAFLKNESGPRYRRLEDLTAVDESARRPDPAHEQRFGPRPDFSLVYTLLSFDTASRLRLKVGLSGREPEAKSVTPVWPSANWYEREVYDMFGIRFAGHPNLKRIIMPDDWTGHPLRKEHPDRATSLAPYTTEEARRFQPLDGAVVIGRKAGEDDFILNFGPHHYSTHGIIRFVLDLQGEQIGAMQTEIGYHHRGAEKIGERQTWHQFIPYTDRLDYLGGVANNLSYVTAVEKLAGIEVPERAQCIRVMLSEFFRLSNHLLWYGTMVQDLGMMSAIFYAFRERETIMDIIEFVTGARLHPAWFRIGGTAMDLPEGWKERVDAFVKIFPKAIREYEALFTKNPIFKARTKGIGRLPLDQAMDWGVTGANLRASGLEWDLRRKIPYSGYQDYDFEIPTAAEGDCYARYLVRMEEMRQSLRIIEQAAARMPEGRYKAADYRYCLPQKEETLHHIESLIHHFINTSRGPRMPRGEAYAATEAPRGEQGFYVVSDGLNAAYRLHMRSPGYANVQALPLMSLGHTVADFVAIIGSVDYIMPDIDR